MKGFPAGILDTTGWTGGVGVHVEFDFGAPSVIQLLARGRGFLSRRKCDGAIRAAVSLENWRFRGVKCLGLEGIVLKLWMGLWGELEKGSGMGRALDVRYRAALFDIILYNYVSLVGIVHLAQRNLGILPWNGVYYKGNLMSVLIHHIVLELGIYRRPIHPRGGHLSYKEVIYRTRQTSI